MSYDSRLAFDPSLERAGAIENLIEQEPHLFSLQRSCEIAEGRAFAIQKALRAALDPGVPASRHFRLTAIYQRACRVAENRANALQAAIEEWGEE